LNSVSSPHSFPLHTFKIILLSGFFLVILPLKSFALTPLVLDEKGEKFSLDQYIGIIEDRDNKLSFEDVSTAIFSNKFVPVSGTNFGFTQSAYWVRFTLENTLPKTSDWLLEIRFPFLDNIELYSMDKNGQYRLRRAGRSLPFSKREIKHRNFIFNLQAYPGSNTYYMRFKTESGMFFPMTIWRKETFVTYDHDAQYVLGLYYGIILVMILYNLFIYISLKDSAYLHYILYISCFMLYQMTSNGLAYEYLWPDSIWWNRRSTIFFAGLAMFWGIKFTQSFLLSRATTPTLDKILSVEKGAAALLTALSFFVSYGVTVKIALLIAAVVVPTMLLTGTICWVRKNRSARFFLLAWISLLAGLFVLVLRNFGFLQASFVVIYSLQIGSILDVVLLALALADRINTMRKERDDAMNRALIEQQKTFVQRENMIMDLHDGVGGLTTNIYMLAESALRFVKVEDIRKAIGTISNLAKESLFEISLFTKSGDKSGLNWDTFNAELRTLGDNIVKGHGISFSLDVNIDSAVQKPEPVFWMNVFKIYKESLANVIKHSGATKVGVEISIKANKFTMTVKDNGHGTIDSKTRGRGLSNMQKRARTIGGILEVNSNNGTEVHLAVPLPLKYPISGMD